MVSPAAELPPLPEPLEVVIKGHEEPIAYACPKCGLLFIVAKKEPEDRAMKMQEAAAHCVKVCVCGKPLDYHYFLRCADCREKAEVEKEKARFEKAEKLSLEQYDGPLYWEGHEGGMGDGFFVNIDEILDYCESEGVEVPKYVWACKANAFKLDAHDIVTNELERQNIYEEAIDQIGDLAVSRLQAYFDAWLKEVDITSYDQDRTRAVLLREPSPSEPPVSS